jgi:hypothetical protein
VREGEERSTKEEAFIWRKVISSSLEWGILPISAKIRPQRKRTRRPSVKTVVQSGDKRRGIGKPCAVTGDLSKAEPHIYGLLVIRPSERAPVESVVAQTMEIIVVGFASFN